MLETTTNAISEETEIEAVAPTQAADIPKWEFKGRQQQKWGVVTKDGLVVGRGANKKTVPPDEVYKLAALGCTNKEIGQWFGVDSETIKYNFHEYIQRGKEDLKVRLRRAQINAALNGNVVMLIFLGKQYLGQSDNPTNNDMDKVLPWSDE